MKLPIFHHNKPWGYAQIDPELSHTLSQFKWNFQNRQRPPYTLLPLPKASAEDRPKYKNLTLSRLVYLLSHPELYNLHGLDRLEVIPKLTFLDDNPFNCQIFNIQEQTQNKQGFSLPKPKHLPSQPPSYPPLGENEEVGEDDCPFPPLPIPPSPLSLSSLFRQPASPDTSAPLSKEQQAQILSPRMTQEPKIEEHDKMAGH